MLYSESPGGAGGVIAGWAFRVWGLQMRRVIAVCMTSFINMGLSARAADLSGGSSKDIPALYGPEHSWAGLYVGGM